MARTFTFDGKKIPFEEGDTLASALHRHGVRALSRSMKYHRPRGLYCATGSCASCYVSVDGVPNTPACTTAAQGGAKVVSQNRIGSARRDLLRVVDRAYPEGFEPHKAFTFPGVVNRMFVGAVRFMSGWGKAPRPGHQAAAAGTRTTSSVETLVIGAGAAGLRVALASTGGCVVVDERRLIEPWSTAEERRLAEQVSGRDDIEVWAEAVAFGIYEDVIAVRRGPDLVEVRAQHIHVATGHHDPAPVFENNDLPGIMTERAARRLLFGHGVLPGARIVIDGGPIEQELADRLTRAGAELVAAGTVQRAHGDLTVTAARIDGRRIPCDCIIVARPGPPRAELLQQAGCDMGWNDGPAPVLDADGATSRTGVSAHFGGTP